jgi:ABC-type multidrug transport system ATPase subunit
VHSAIEMRSVEQRVRSRHTTLRDISITIGRGEMVAIIGRSGAGKTALLDTMCGRRAASSGEITRISGSSGYVPQDDIIHLAPPLARTLRYAAALREVSTSVVDDVLRKSDSLTRSSGQVSGMYAIRAPRALANSLMPFTELWLSAVWTNRFRRSNG